MEVEKLLRMVRQLEKDNAQLRMQQQTKTEGKVGDLRQITMMKYGIIKFLILVIRKNYRLNFDISCVLCWFIASWRLKRCRKHRSNSKPIFMLMVLYQISETSSIPAATGFTPAQTSMKKRIEELEEALRESVSITAEREMHLSQQKHLLQQCSQQVQLYEIVKIWFRKFHNYHNSMIVIRDINWRIIGEFWNIFSVSFFS